MKKRLCLTGFMLSLALSPALHSQQVGGTAPGPAGQVGYIFLPSPVVPEAEADSQPIPRLPDGKIDITGPWVGGGSNVDIELEGGLKPGELPLLPWAKELRDKRKEEQEPYTACLPMGVPRANPYPWKFAMSYTSKGLTHIYVLHETGDAGAHRVDLHGRPHASATIRFRPGGATRSASWEGHARHRHRRLQRQVLVRQPRHAAHRAAAHDRALDPHQLGRAHATSSRSTTRAPSRGPYDDLQRPAAAPGSEGAAES